MRAEKFGVEDTLKRGFAFGSWLRGQDNAKCDAIPTVTGRVGHVHAVQASLMSFELPTEAWMTSRAIAVSCSVRVSTTSTT